LLVWSVSQGIRCRITKYNSWKSIVTSQQGGSQIRTASCWQFSISSSSHRMADCVSNTGDQAF
jgi:hypothetical protein